MQVAALNSGARDDDGTGHEQQEGSGLWHALA